MKKFKVIIALFIATISIFVLPRQQIFAANQVDYNVNAILPDNQLQRGRSFFDLRVAPGQKQTLKMKINNYSNKKQKYYVDVNTATTNGNLTIDYTNNKTPKKSINFMPINKMVKYPKTVEVPAKKSAIVSLNVTYPKQEFNGILLGGIHVKRDFSAERKEQPTGFMSQYDYVIGLMVSQNDNSESPNVIFKKIIPANITNNAGLKVQLQNTQMINAKNVKMSARVSNLKSPNKVIMERNISAGGIAPKSLFDVDVYNGEPGKTKPLKAGKYQMVIDLSDEAGHTWNFKKNFEITKKDAQVVNEDVFTVKSDNTMLYVIIGLLAGIIVLGLLILLFRKNKKKETVTKENDDKK